MKHKKAKRFIVLLLFAALLWTAVYWCARDAAKAAAEKTGATLPFLLNVPYINQRMDYPTGCESVSAVMALQYAGVDITVDTFIDDCLDTGERPAYEDGVRYGCDPWEAFQGIDFADRNGDGSSDAAMLFELDGQQVLMVWFWDAETETFVFRPEESLVEGFAGGDAAHQGLDGTWYLEGEDTAESVIGIGVAGDWILYEQSDDTLTAIDSGMLRVLDEAQGHYAADSERFDDVSYLIATAGENGLYWGVTGDYDYYERLD